MPDELAAATANAVIAARALPFAATILRRNGYEPKEA